MTSSAASSASQSGNVARLYYPLQSSKDLDPLMERIGNARIVLLGEASHGTHEYYTWRMAISKRLVAEKGFNFIAVEGDWPDCYRINRYVKGYFPQGTTAKNILSELKRWPTWMWANYETMALAEWLKQYNDHLPAGKKVGFYGLDVYSLWESLEVIVDYLKKVDPRTAEFAIQVLNCFEPYEEGHEYASALYNLSSDCKNEVVRLLKEVRENVQQYSTEEEAGLNAQQNAMVITNAEKYYRSMISKIKRGLKHQPSLKTHILQLTWL